ncbi:MAG: hypothetical protein ACQES5_12185 [Thermodesulfobacteriota bacterium]
MKNLFFLSSLILALILVTLTASTARAGNELTSCTCEDWDKDGRFGAVLHKFKIDKKVLKSNIGDYKQCAAYKSSLSRCNGKIDFCACEDWDKDGRFGMVLYEVKKYSPRVLKSNIGDYYKCTAFKSKLSQCK